MTNKLEKITILNPGDEFMYKGFEWVTLDKDEEGIFAMMTHPWETIPFDENNRNDWRVSSVRETILKKLLPVIGEGNLIMVESDLTADNGDTSYGATMDYITMITCDQFRKYRNIILKYLENFPDWLLTITPWTCKDKHHDGNHVRFVFPSGAVGYSNAGTNYGVAPACKFSSARLNLCRQAQLVETSE